MPEGTFQSQGSALFYTVPHTGAVIITMTLLPLAWKTPKDVQVKCKDTSALPCLHTELSKAQLSSSNVPVQTHTITYSQDPKEKFKRETQLWENQAKSPSIRLKAAAAFFSPSSVQPLCTGPRPGENQGTQLQLLWEGVKQSRTQKPTKPTQREG